jgi:hypothetical protein
MGEGANKMIFNFAILFVWVRLCPDRSCQSVRKEVHL